MMSARAKWIFGGAAVLLAAGILIAFAFFRPAPAPSVPAVVPPAPTWPVSEVIGTSTEGRAIIAYTYGTGPTHLLFVGGMHGGYEWNAVLLAYQFMDWLAANRTAVPANLSITVVPEANPDGVYKVTGKVGRFAAADVSPDPAIDAAGRFTATGVDLNRNFGCHWAPTSMWQNKTESAGTAAFSEPEAQAVRAIVEETHPAAAVFWHSASGSVYASECGSGILPGTSAVMNAYAKASGYSAVDTFDAYPITGDSEGWLASIGIPAVTVELKTHQTVEWEQNLAGIKALFALYSQSAG